MIDEWCAGVISYLVTTFPDADVEDGEQDGVVRDKDVIAVWWPGWDELTRDIALAQPTLSLRYFPSRSKLPTSDAPAIGQPLRQAADALITAFDRGSQAVGFFTADLACRLASLRPNYDPAVWRVDGTLIAYTLGAGA